MTALDIYSSPSKLPASDAARIGRLLGLKTKLPLDDIELADRISHGLRPSSAAALSAIIGKANIVGPVISEASLRRAVAAQKKLSRELSERLYEVGRVIDAVSRVYHGDNAAISRFLNRPHQLLNGQTPLQLASSSSAGADAVINLVRRADAGVAL